MTKKKIFLNSILMIIGVNASNFINYLIYFFILRLDTDLFNQYTVLFSILTIVLVPASILLRIFNTFGISILNKYSKTDILKGKNLLLISIINIIIILGISLLLAIYKFSIESIIIVVSIYALASVLNIYRGLSQNREKFINFIVSLNVDAIIRLVLSIFLGVHLKLGINGILIAIIIGYLGGLLVSSYKFKSTVDKIADENFKIKEVLFSGFLITLALEVISNIDILIANYILGNNEILTTYNTLQFLRKTIYFFAFALTGIVLSLGTNKNYSKKFTLQFTFIAAFLSSTLVALILFLTQGISFNLLGFGNYNLYQTEIMFFFIGTIFYSISYLLANWIFTQQIFQYIYLIIPLIFLEVIIFFIFGNNFRNISISFVFFNFIFLLSTLAFIGFKSRKGLLK